MATEMKYCGKCGAPLEEGTDFCTFCGSRIDAEPQQTAPKMMYCENCGRQIAASAVFCRFCGTPTGAASQQQRRPAQPQQNTAQPQWNAAQPQQNMAQPQRNMAQVQQNIARVQQMSAPAGKKAGKRKGGMFSLIAMILVVCIVVTGFVKPGFFLKKGGNPGSQAQDAGGAVNRVQVILPNPTGPEAMVGMEANIALQYYIEARMYLELLSTYDAENADPEELRQLVDDALTAFENADKISESLGRSVDLWMEADDRRDPPEIKVLQTASADTGATLGGLFVTTAYAKDRSASEMTAQEIVDAYDKAKNGQKIKALAELLGTDAKHAYAELKIAQATLEGADATKIADQATECIKVAKTLKTAGTVAGLVIAAAPVATGAVATMATGELIATGGGIVMGAVNSTLEVTSTGATLYYGTDENKVTKRADEISDSSVMKTANMIVGIAGVGYNIKNQISDVNKLIDDATKLEEYEKLLTSLTTNNGKEASNLFGILSFGLGNIDPSEGTVMGIKVDNTPNGVLFNIQDTKAGTSPEQQEAIKTVLKDSGYTEAEADAAVQHGVELMESGEKPEETAPDPAADLPENTVKQTLKDNEAISPGSTYIDLDDFIDGMETFLETITKGKTETAEEKPAGGENWVEPYAYSGASDVVELFRFMREVHPTAMEVTPYICYSNSSGNEIDFTNKETFVIDLTSGAQTVYKTSFADGDPDYGQEYQITMTFTGDPDDDGKYGDLMKLSSTGTESWRQNGKISEYIDEPDCAIYTQKASRHNQEKSGGKALHVGNGTPYSIDFIINRICIPGE